MSVFGLVVGIAIYIHEVNDDTPEDPPIEILQEISVAFAFALPIGVGLSLVIGRRLTEPTTERLDRVITSASSMTGQRLDQRLPVGVADDALDRLASALNGAFERIETGVSAQRQFAADASHELRTPIAVMLANLEVARRKPRENSHWESVADSVLDELRRMNGLVDKLLMLARTGEAALVRVPTELRAIADLAVRRAVVIAEPHQVAVSLVPGPEVWAEVDGDAMSIVVDNLLRNAIDHAPRGTQVDVRVEPRRVVVEDRGPGVPPELRKRIFQPFARGNHRVTDRAAGIGMGLGLAICQRIVDGHGGTITVEDREGGGASFVITLPAPRRSDDGVRAESCNAHDAGASSPRESGAERSHDELPCAGRDRGRR